MEAHNYGQRQIEKIKSNNEIEKGKVIVYEKSLGEMRAWRDEILTKILKLIDKD